MLLLFFSTRAFAASGTARVVLVANGNAALARSVSAEAEHVGIVVTSGLTGATSDDAAHLAAVGVVELVSPDRVRLHVAGTGEHAAYDALIERSPDDGDGFALRVVEALRGRLVELALLPAETALAEAASAAPSGGVPTPTESGARPPRDAAPGPRAPSYPFGAFNAFGPTLGIAIGGGATVAAGGLGVSPSIALGLRVEPIERLAVSVHALLAVAENDVIAPEGEASAKVNLFGAELGYRFAPDAWLVQPEFGVGASFSALQLEAETAAPREAHSDQLVTGVYSLNGGAGVFVTPWLRMRATARAGVSAPRPVLVFDEREVATWGRFVFFATLTAEVQLPLRGFGVR